MMGKIEGGPTFVFAGSHHPIIPSSADFDLVLRASPGGGLVERYRALEEGDLDGVHSTEVPDGVDPVPPAHLDMRARTSIVELPLEPRVVPEDAALAPARRHPPLLDAAETVEAPPLAVTPVLDNSLDRLVQ